jgi:hypothetical protein
MVVVLSVYILVSSVDVRAFGALSYYQSTLVVVSQPASWLVFLLVLVTVRDSAELLQPSTLLSHFAMRHTADAVSGSAYRMVSLCFAVSVFSPDKVICDFKDFAVQQRILDIITGFRCHRGALRRSSK